MDVVMCKIFVKGFLWDQVSAKTAKIAAKINLIIKAKVMITRAEVLVTSECNSNDLPLNLKI